MVKNSKIKTLKSKPKTSVNKYVYAIGRRKSATARIRLYSGKGKTVVNKKPIEEYFSGRVAQVLYLKPFSVTNTMDKYYTSIEVVGSGKSSQLLAVVHGITRALDRDNKELYHQLLKKSGLLTRDQREKERRKPGQMGKARKQKQSPKR